jgi:bifunctional non-homologous end joining protein LigD
MHIPEPLPLGRRCTPFDHPEWIYELKYDGFRAMAVIEKGQCRFLSPYLHPLGGFDELSRGLLTEIKTSEAIFDGELAVADEDGRCDFPAMMQGRRAEARYFAFDLLFDIGQDLRHVPLLARKRRLHSLLQRRSVHIVYVDHVIGCGEKLFDLVTRLDLEGIVAKRADSLYITDEINPPWLTIQNKSYSQNDGRANLFTNDTR